MLEFIFYLSEAKDLLLYRWQTLVGSLIGALAPLFVLWCAEKYKSKKNSKEYIYYLQRMIIDQINSLIELRDTTKKFLNEKLKSLISHIDENPSDAYSLDSIFFPLFSVRQIPDDVNKTSSNSGYIDNKVAKIYALSNDFPHITNDIRLQLRDTLERNEKIALGKHNSPAVQKTQYRENILGFEKMIKDDLLGKSIPMYMLKLTETLVAVEEKAKMSSYEWKRKFDPRWKLYISKNLYLQDRARLVSDMDAYFAPTVRKNWAKLKPHLKNNPPPCHPPHHPIK